MIKIRWKTLCENRKIGTSAAEAALKLQSLCRGYSLPAPAGHDPQSFRVATQTLKACPTTRCSLSTLKRQRRRRDGGATGRVLRGGAPFAKTLTDPSCLRVTRRAG